MGTPTGGLRPGSAGARIRATSLSRTRVALPGWQWPARTCAVYYASLACSATVTCRPVAAWRTPPLAAQALWYDKGWTRRIRPRGEHARVVRAGDRRQVRGQMRARTAWGWLGKRDIGDAVPDQLAKRLPCPGKTRHTRTRALLAPEKACEARVAERIYEESEASSVRSGPRARSRSAAARRYLVAQV